MKLFTLLRETLSLTRKISKKDFCIISLKIFLDTLLSIIKIILPVIFLYLIKGNLPYIAIVGIIVLTFISGNILNIFERFLKDRRKILNLKAEIFLAEKLLKADYSLFDEEDFLDSVSASTHGLKAYTVLENAVLYLSKAIESFFIMLVIMIYMLFMSPFILLFFIIEVSLQMLINKKFNDSLEVFFQNLFPINRRFEFLIGLKFDLDKQKDIRAFNMIQMILGKTTHYNKKTIRLFDEMNKKTSVNQILNNVINNCVLSLSLFFAASQFLGFFKLGKISIYELITLINVILYLNASVLDLVNNVTSSRQMLQYMKPVIKIANLNSKLKKGEPIGDIERIEFKDVNFKYPNSKDYILKNVSFTIENLESVALIGLNGSGKTTLVKLLCGLYQAVDSG